MTVATESTRRYGGQPGDRRVGSSYSNTQQWNRRWTDQAAAAGPRPRG
jgi:hypothetical protein